MLDDQLTVLINDPDIPGIEDWLSERRILLKDFEVVDVSDLTIYYDVMLKIVFVNHDDAILFKMTWMSR